jgi:LuxR family transcriptional regulator, maltose regulon positive regulatory protein
VIASTTGWQPASGQTLLQTKLTLPPARPFLVPRPHLVAQLDAAAANSRMTLISAPAGFGKTTLAGEWIQARQGQGDIFCWVSLDEMDNDPLLFWSYVLAALERAGVPIGRQLQAALTAPAPPPLMAVIAHLLNALQTIKERIVFILDDYHVIDEGVIHEQVGLLVERLPPPHHLFLLTRADPPLPLARWRARREMAEVRQAALRFDQPQTARLLNEKLALGLSAGEVAVLERRTEGWVAGLQMAALALGQRDVNRQAFIESFAGSHYYIMTYLVDEVLATQPPEVQQFLLETAVLRRLCAPLCTAVTGYKESGALLQALYHQNLFLVALDDAHRSGGAHYWYRTHHLFADLLATRLEGSRTPAEINGLQRRAAEWFDANGFLEEAVYHALRCGDIAWAAEVVERQAPLMMQQGRLNTLLRWIGALETETLARRPRLRLAQAWSLFLSGQAAETKPILLATRRLLQEEPELAPDEAVRGELATLLANCASVEEDVEQVMAEVKEALAYLPADDADLRSVIFRARALNAAGAAHGLAGDTEQLVATSREVQRLALLGGNAFLAAHALSTIADARFHQGRLHEAKAANRKIIQFGKEIDVIVAPPFTGMGHIGLSAVQLERYELAEAAQSLDQGLAISGQGGIGYKHLDAYCTLARLRAAQGDGAGAAAALEQAQAFAPLPWHKVHLAAYAVLVWLGQGSPVRARQCLERAYPGQMPLVVAEVFKTSQARLALAEGNWPEVLVLYDAVVPGAAQEKASRMARVVEMSLFKALALEALGKREEALDSLEMAVNLAAPQGAVLTFLEAQNASHHGHDLGVLLRTLSHQGRAPQPYTSRLLALLPTAGSQSGLVEPLSARELQVLRLIAAGKRNKEIAAALTVSLNTVKKHSSHIYQKLGVDGRTQAVARARELNLL